MTNTTGASDLLTGIPFRHDGVQPDRRLPPELLAARALCRQMRREKARPEKQRIAHLICLNLVTMLKRKTAH